MLLVGIPFAQPILLLFGYPEELLAIGTGYFMVQIANLGVVIFNSSFIAIQKAKGDTRSIFFLNIISMLIKLGLTSLFIYVMKVQDTIYVAFATLTSQVVLFFILLIIINKKDSAFKVNLFKFSLSPEYLKKILVLSIPIFFGKFVFSFGKVSVNAMCKSYGPLVVGALAVSNNICGLITSPGNSFEEGGSTIVSQNLGNNNKKRALAAFWRTLLVASVIGIIGYILVRFIFQDALISLFSKAESQSTGAEASYFMGLIKQINDYDTLSIIALAINAAVLGVLYGFGQTGLAMIINIARVFVFRIPVLWYFQTFHPEMGAECAGISMGISNICIAIMSMTILGIFLLNLRRKDKKESLKQQQNADGNN